MRIRWLALGGLISAQGPGNLYYGSAQYKVESIPAAIRHRIGVGILERLQGALWLWRKVPALLVSLGCFCFLGRPILDGPPLDSERGRRGFGLVTRELFTPLGMLYKYIFTLPLSVHSSPCVVWNLFSLAGQIGQARQAT